MTERVVDIQADVENAEFFCKILINFRKTTVKISRLLTATLAWPVPWVVQVGVILSTLGAALQSLTGAPRLLAAIANDDILPILKYFKAPDGVEPHLATLFTMLICSGCVVIGNLDLITPIITMFYLLCYGGVNLSCVLLDLLDAPSWRPRWKFHHWGFSLVGALLCIGNDVSPSPFQCELGTFYDGRVPSVQNLLQMSKVKLVFDIKLIFVKYRQSCDVKSLLNSSKAECL